MTPESIEMIQIQTVKVGCYAGYRADERPCRVYLDGRHLVIEGIREQWITPESRCFKVVTTDNCIYRLEQNRVTDCWTIRPVS